MAHSREQRKHPRYIVDCPLSLSLSNDEIVEMTVHDISMGGIQIHCNRITAHKMQYEYESKKEKLSTKFNIKMIFNQEDFQGEIEATCNLVYILKQEEDVYAIGMKFSRVEGENHEKLEKLISTFST